ncbi:MAG: PQQ-binding-like beta-propeller repeat protein [Microthrixaceae bacterium]
MDPADGTVQWVRDIPWAPSGRVSVHGDEQVLVAASSANGLDPSLVSVRGSDGAPLWQRFVTDAGTRPLVQTDSTAVTADGEKVIAVDPGTGELRWSAEAGMDVDLISADGVVVVGSNSGARVVDAMSGEERWQRDLESGRGSILLTDGGVVIALDGDGDLVGLELTNGNEVWRTRAERPRFWSVRYDVVGDTAVVASSEEAADDAGGTREWLNGIDTRTGEVRWTQRMEGSSYLTVIAGDLVIDDAGLHAVARDAHTGAEVWRFDTPGIKQVSQLTDDTVLIATTSAVTFSGVTLHALDAGNGAVMWTSEVPGVDISDPTVIGDTVVIGTSGDQQPTAAGMDGSITAVRLADGATVWRTEVRDEVAERPVSSNGSVLALSADQPLFCD